MFSMSINFLSFRHSPFRKLVPHSLAALALTAFVGCASIDCSLDSVVVWTLTFYDSETEEPLKLPCILNVEALGGGTLYNRAENVTSIELPMSNANPTDTLLLNWITVQMTETEEGISQSIKEMQTDVLFLDHTNHPHFDAIDCPGAIFHNITNLSLDRSYRSGDSPMKIDSIRIIRPTVDYFNVENIRLYLTPAPESPAE